MFCVQGADLKLVLMPVSRRFLFFCNSGNNLRVLIGNIFQLNVDLRYRARLIKWLCQHHLLLLLTSISLYHLVYPLQGDASYLLSCYGQMTGAKHDEIVQRDAGLPYAKCSAINPTGEERWPREMQLHDPSIRVSSSVDVSVVSKGTTNPCCEVGQ